MDITPYYIDARNAITQPDKMVFLSQYFRRHWMPVLGPLGTAVVIYLRGACYHNRKSGETRDTIQISQREIANGCGCSVPTVKRELERNEALRRFVQVSHEWERDGATGRVRQVENHYKVAMDDPLTEADEVRLRQMVEVRITQERQAQETTGGERRKSIRKRETETNSSVASNAAVFTSAQNEAKHECSNAVFTATTAVNRGNGTRDSSKNVPAAHFELLRPAAHFESTPIQNELLDSESLLKTTEEQTLNVKAGDHFAISEKPLSSPSVSAPAPSSNYEQSVTSELTALVEELRDWGSERRHRQLLTICDQHGLQNLPRQALQATRERLAKETRRGVVEKPGAYYQSVLIKLLETHQVFVPTAGEDDQEEVRRLIKRSLGLEEAHPFQEDTPLGESPVANAAACP